MPFNGLGQPIGHDLGDWAPPPTPPPASIRGGAVVLEPLRTADHGPALWESLEQAPLETWTYMNFGPFAGYGEFEVTLQSLAAMDGWLPYALIVDDRPTGFACYLRIEPPLGTIEIGSIVFSPALQRTTAATEALFLMIDNVFGLGYRRCEWKCDSLNEPSRRAAVRLGFTYEGTFRQATHYKGRNRDTAWYAIIDREWPALAEGFTRWMADENFDDSGRQISSLEEMRST